MREAKATYWNGNAWVDNVHVYFHCWGNDCIEDTQNGNATFTVAICEGLDGNVVKVSPESLVFIQDEPMDKIPEQKWETIPHECGGYLSRMRVPGGWLVKYTEDVYTNWPQDHRAMETGSEFQTSLTFVPDARRDWLPIADAIKQ